MPSKAFTFDEIGRDMWSVYLIDNARGGMRIQLDLHTKKVNIDGTHYYSIVDASLIKNYCWGSEIIDN